MAGGDQEETHLLNRDEKQQQQDTAFSRRSYGLMIAVASKEKQQQQQQQDTARDEARNRMSSDRHPSEDLDVPGEMPDKPPNKKGLKLQLNVREAAEHNQQLWQHQQQRQQQLLTPGSSRGTPKPMNVAVFLKEGHGHPLSLEKGKITSAGEMKTMMLVELNIPKTSSHVFSIWFISPHLELQLKDHHIPFLLRKQWADLLKEFSSCKEEDERLADEPVLVFQRNSFLGLEDEEKQTNKAVITRLFEEARHNILTTRYPVPIPDAEILGGMLARIKHGPYNAETHKNGFFKKSLSDFLPYYAIGSNKLVQFIRHSSSEQRLLQQYERASKKSTDELSCYRQFLTYCRSLPFYGCAFFKGTAIQDGFDMKPWKSSEKHVSVGINRNGITLFETSKEEVLIHLPYDDLSWEFIKDDERSDDVERKDVFCIEYDTVDEDGEHIPEQVQITSNQACMMDAMVTSCIKFMEVMNIPKTPTSADYKKILDISYSMNPSKKQNFSLTRPFKR